jgi:hypothetical protein
MFAVDQSGDHTILNLLFRSALFLLTSLSWPLLLVFTILISDVRYDLEFWMRYVLAPITVSLILAYVIANSGNTSSA